jgi:hypothetical protein
MKVSDKVSRTLGWIAVGISTAIASVWAFWGILENFHEGWYYQSLLQNISLAFIQYLSIPVILVLLTLIAIRWRRIGSSILFLAAIGLGVFFGLENLATLALIIPPVIILGFLFWFGRPEPKKYAYIIPVVIPAIIILSLGIPNLIKVSHRLNDGDFGARLVEGNGVELIWAPQGPGWPGYGVSWDEAENICLYLSKDGMAVADTPQNIWRLPTVEEAVSSMTRHGANAGGIWDPEIERATYEIEPDKETPLWNPHSPIIYYWTSAELNEQKAYMIVYNGQVQPRNKTGMGSLGFRAVKDVK